MFHDSFDKLELPEKQALLERLNPAFIGTTFHPEDTTILSIDLEFYPGYKFYDIADHSVAPARQRYAVANDDHFEVLDYTNAPLYRLNQKVPLKLDDSLVCEYVRFFFTFVRGQHGRFLLAENVNDIPWSEDPPPHARKTIGQMLKPVTYQNQDEDGTYHLKMTMIFKDTLFDCDVHVDSRGFVEINQEHILIEDIPVIDDVIGR